MSTEEIVNFYYDTNKLEKVSESQKTNFKHDVDRRIIQAQNHLIDLGLEPKFVKDNNSTKKKSLEKAITDLNLLENISL
ncbi:MAG: hypothetical protein F6K63_29325 [Moorea sp. SIO1G6]|uniref:hypothetical protein n=1 Tax=Moorena sp. SIO1G6 TaxID=2607840 RepID=UPI0013C1B546|nr:hypothetical protein [Moorena sp. SIO1G6]NET68275.1 hypothetical protein [Moorena sp. SIO1G6]